MQADDPRHGTYAGAVAHWLTHTPICEPCGQAAYRYVKRNRLDIAQGEPRTVPILGTRRRIRALAALGYSFNQIAVEMGCDRTHVSRWANAGHKTYVTRRIADLVAEVYERLSMTIPDNANRRRDYFRLMAARKGWSPPLAWDDIDDPNERPKGLHSTDNDIDPVVVDRILAGDWRLTCTPAEKTAVCERWAAGGGSLTELGRLTGWRPSRYYKVGEAA